MRLCVTLCGVLGCILLVGCSSTKLTRNNVRELIGSFPPDNNKTSDSTETGIIGSSCAAPQEVLNAKAQGLELAHLVAIKHADNCGAWDIELTPLASKDAYFAEILLAKYRGDYTVTGITQEDTHARALIAWNYELTPSGRAYMETFGSPPLTDQYEACRYQRVSHLLVCTYSYGFVRYDDGWRRAD